MEHTPDTQSSFYDVEHVASATECTGLSPAAVQDDAQAEAYADLYAMHPQKPAGGADGSAGRTRRRRKSQPPTN